MSIHQSYSQTDSDIKSCTHQGCKERTWQTSEPRSNENPSTVQQQMLYLLTFKQGKNDNEAKTHDFYGRLKVRLNVKGSKVFHNTNFVTSKCYIPKRTYFSTFYQCITEYFHTLKRQAHC